MNTSAFIAFAADQMQPGKMSTRAHIALAVLVIAVLVGIVFLVRRQHLKTKYAMLWLSIGVLLAVFAAVPGLLDWAGTQLGVYYQPILLVLLGLGLLLLIVIHFSYELTRSEERTRTLAEEIALLQDRIAQLESPTSNDDRS